MFSKKSSQGGRAIILIALSLILLFCDHQFHCFNAMRSKLSFVAIPIQYVINWPLDLTRSLAVNLKSKQAVLQENRSLSSELLLINAKLQRLEFLEKENSQLRALLYSSQQIKGKVLSAEIIMSEPDNLSQKITINKGRQQGVYVGQPVFDAHGLLGQVILVESNMSKALLISNKKSAIPVMVVRNRMQTIALGMGGGKFLELVNIPETADIKVGDSLVTSGIENLFPAGFQVGIVKDIKHITGERFMRVLVVPKAQMNIGSHVILVWPDLPDKIKKSVKKQVKKRA
ncbi:MAG: rod shape-determining protein MreC [Gammaproteobacteria bacterium]|nr:rod shape-determining protein MreC [Gammaproteobacteria bacterium]